MSHRKGPCPAHTVTADDGSFSVTIDGGESDFLDLGPGTYTFKCNFHSSMTGTLVVV